MTDYSEAESVAVEQIFPSTILYIYATFIGNRHGKDGLRTTNITFLRMMGRGC